MNKISADDYRRVYELLGKADPVPFDCGILCGAACCRQDAGLADGEELADGGETELGMYLLPGEEVMHDRKDPWLTWEADNAEDYDFPESFHGTVWFVRCSGPENCRQCNRNKRPIQCRTFPLEAHLTQDGELKMLRSEMDLPYVCPLTNPNSTLNEDFVKNAYEAWRILIKDQKIRDLVWQDSRARDAALGEGEEHDYL